MNNRAQLLKDLNQLPLKIRYKGMKNVSAVILDFDCPNGQIHCLTADECVIGCYQSVKEFWKDLEDGKMEIIK